jgi:predicted methyltransferase
MKVTNIINGLLLLTMSLAGPAAIGSDFEAVKASLEKAMAAPVRTTADTDRDANRKPIETLEFFGLRDDMKVVELFPGGGWYTKLLAPVLAENGEFYIAFGTSRAQSLLQSEPGFENMQVTAGGAEITRAPGARFYSASNTQLPQF